MAPIIFIVSLIMMLAYVLLMSSIMTSWDDLDTPETLDITTTDRSLAILVIGRDESAHILACLSSIQASYARLHVSLRDRVTLWYVDDGSSDGTYEMAQSLITSYMEVDQLPSHLQGKKAARDYAITYIEADDVLMTDADCLVPSDWIMTMWSQHIAHYSLCSTGPIVSRDCDNLLGDWQYLDLLGMLPMTAYGIAQDRYRLANGGNMIVSREAYLQVHEDMHGQAHASGDDVFLMQAIHAGCDGQVAYIHDRSAVVTTEPEISWRSLVEQRHRWASKAQAYSKSWLVIVQGYAWIYIVISLLSILLSSWSGGMSLYTGILMLAAKLTMDYLLLSRMSDYIGHRRPLKRYLPVAIVHMLYIMLAGAQAIIPTNYTWKGRQQR